MVNLIRRSVVSGLVVGMFGCSSFDYPDHGQGGLAESYQDISIENYQFSPVMPDEPLGPEHGLRFDWQLTKLHWQKPLIFCATTLLCLWLSLAMRTSRVRLSTIKN